MPLSNLALTQKYESSETKSMLEFSIHYRSLQCFTITQHRIQNLVNVNCIVNIVNPVQSEMENLFY